MHLLRGFAVHQGWCSSCSYLVALGGKYGLVFGLSRKPRGGDGVVLVDRASAGLMLEAHFRSADGSY